MSCRRLVSNCARTVVIILGSGAVLSGSSVARAGDGEEVEVRPVDRRFTFVEETLHGAPEGHWEFEQWLTWQTHTDEDSDFNRIKAKEELEYGLAENVHVALELADWHWMEDRDGDEVKYDATGGELKIRILDPRTDPIGLGYKTEAALGEHKLEWENILILDKIMGPWEVAYNLKLGADWEGEDYFDYDENGGEIVQSAGVSYEVNPNLYLGGELLYEIPMPDWTTGHHQNVFLGPDLAVHGEGWALATTALVQATGGDDEPSFQLRTIFEIDF